MKKYISRSLNLLCLFSVAMLFASCTIGRFVYYNFANITDHKIFPSRTAKSDSIKFHYAVSKKPKAPKTLTVGNKETTFDDYLKNSNTVAFIIIKNDSIQYEKYFSGYNEESVVASFSMAKSVTSILIGCALDDGLIKSIEEPMVNYIPELNHDGLEKVTIKDLLDMKSGIRFNESYVNPFGDAATYYYGRNLRSAIKRRKLAHAPGGEFEYSSGDTQLLGLVLERALKGKTITNYLEEKLWKPLGMEYDATWSLDKKKDGLEKTFCCINARARDFAKLGRLYLNKGNWNGKQIVSSQWVKESTTPTPGNQEYTNQWWLNGDGSYSAKGILGQYIYVNPAKNLIIVRLGKNHGNTDWDGLFASLAAKY
ncbi:serine hydrolase [Flavobacterium album]|uniref:Serine hydrolase n=1 Tax=Flavobacterium album TaxID=2175091 RepID=A0A2S1R0L3_9FLAO|nr:serine hydrolase [Flavobacterium album]AWH86217.1 serine hydrolase [Flavobacterium album]